MAILHAFFETEEGVPSSSMTVFSNVETGKVWYRTGIRPTREVSMAKELCETAAAAVLWFDPIHQAAQRRLAERKLAALCEVASADVLQKAQEQMHRHVLATHELDGFAEYVSTGKPLKPTQTQLERAARCNQQLQMILADHKVRGKRIANGLEEVPKAKSPLARLSRDWSIARYAAGLSSQSSTRTAAGSKFKQ